jgi:hypothetical protein
MGSNHQRNAGLAELTRQTTQPESNGEPGDDGGRGRPRRGSRPKPETKPDELKGRARKVMIPDNEYNALKKWAWKRGMTFSAIITDLIRQNVPTIELVNRGKKSGSSTEPPAAEADDE